MKPQFTLRIRIVLCAVLSFEISGLSACTSRKQALIGKYHLVRASNCRNEVTGSTLTVRGDGTYDEQVHLNNGQIENIRDERWDYDRRTQQIELPKLLVSPEKSFEVEASHPAVIYINRAAGCSYEQFKEP